MANEESASTVVYMDTVKLRNEIINAQNHELRTHELANLLYIRLQRLHSRISVNHVDPCAQLLRFVYRFVSRTPDLVDTLQEISCHASWEELIEALTQININFFMVPPPALDNQPGMLGAMGKSYLCHRVIEEINDCCKLACNTPLLPLDFTCSNLIIHQLIGESFANQLDDIVHLTTAELDDLFLTSKPRGELRNAEQILASCHQRSLPDQAMLASINIASAFPGCTIH